MGIEAILSFAGLLFAGFGWMWTQKKSMEADALKIEQRLSEIEKSVALNSATDSNANTEIINVRDSFKEFKGDMKDIDNRIREIEIRLAVIDSETKRNK
ncbi:hypothetical protein [Escherichia coli]|uniref:hypothetical protein n=1 Tax=Escherichia coli TaxID=562 RepID=UPI002B3000A5|nr:hypothetical protein VEE23_32970 [Escherichia coli]HCO0724672.1 hypothetical protein [Escherichia coli]